MYLMPLRQLGKMCVCSKQDKEEANYFSCRQYSPSFTNCLNQSKDHKVDVVYTFLRSNFLEEVYFETNPCKASECKERSPWLKLLSAHKVKIGHSEHS